MTTPNLGGAVTDTLEQRANTLIEQEQARAFSCAKHGQLVQTAAHQQSADLIRDLLAALATVREASVRTCSSLAAAISLLERGGKAAKKAAPSDLMFDQMIKDYRRALKVARSALLTNGTPIGHDPDCKICVDGWVCENHPDKSWPSECECGAGMPCVCSPLYRSLAALTPAASEVEG